MNEITPYDVNKHKRVSICWMILNIITTALYIFETVKGNRTPLYSIIIAATIWLPFIAFMISKNIASVSDTALEYIAGIGYLLFYGFAMMTAKTPIVFCLIFPMICILMIYSDKRLNIITMFLAFIINAGAMCKTIFIENKIEPSDITFMEIEVICIALCALFIWQSSAALELRDNALKDLSASATHDMLTKLHNRVYLDNLEYEWQQNNYYIKSLAIVDVDNFKHINDTYGHKIGDVVLKFIALNMQNVANRYTELIPIRIGGDEFIIISPKESDGRLYEAVTELADILRKHKLKTDKNEMIDITLSIGVTNGKPGMTFNDLYITADKALYKAKQNGKDQAVRTHC